MSESVQHAGSARHSTLKGYCINIIFIYIHTYLVCANITLHGMCNIKMDLVCLSGEGRWKLAIEWCQ